jgi:hypothetical protein
MVARLYVSILVIAACLLTVSVCTVRAADAGSATTQPTNDVSGTWKWTSPGPGGDIDFILKIKQDGEKVSGSLVGFNGDEAPVQDGKIQGGKLSFKVVRDFNGNQITTLYTATLENGELKGKSETIFAQDFDAKKE